MADVAPIVVDVDLSMGLAELTSGQLHALMPDEHAMRVYGASRLGACIPQLVANAIGIEPGPPPEALRKAMDEGTDGEPVILADFYRQYPQYQPATYEQLVELKAQGTIAGVMNQPGHHTHGQVEVWIKVMGALVIAHPDHIAWRRDRDEFYVVEAKAFGPSYYKQFMDKGKGLPSFPGYSWQVSAQMCATGMKAIFLVGEKDEEGIVRHVEVRVVNEPLVELGKIKAKIIGCERFAKKGEVPDCDAPSWPCAYWDMPFHLEKSKPTLPIEDVVDLELADALHARYVAGKDAADAKKRSDDAKKIIEKKMAEHGARDGSMMLEAETAAHNKFRVVWVTEEVKYAAREANVGSRSFPKVELVGELVEEEIVEEPDAAD